MASLSAPSSASSCPPPASPAPPSACCPVFLEADNDTSWDLATGAGGGNAFGRRVAAACNRCLRALLARPFPAFLGEIRAQNAHGRSLRKFLDSFLRHRARDIDGVWGGAGRQEDVGGGGENGHEHGGAGPETVIVDGQKQEALRRLDRRVFLVYHRLATRGGGEVSLQGAAAAAGGRDYARVLYDEWLLDVPKILDLCALYGRRRYADRLRAMLVEAFAAQPAYFDDLVQAMAHAAKALVKAEGFIGGFARRVKGGGGGGDDDGGGESKDDADAFITPEQQHRAAVCDVLKYAIDILNALLVLASTVPDIFARGLHDPSAIIEALAPFASTALRNAEKALELAGGVSDVETNAIYLLRSLAIRVGYAVLDHRLLTPLESFIPLRKKDGHGNDETFPSPADRESKRRQHNSAAAGDATNNDWTLDGLRGDIFGALHPLAFREDMASMRSALQMHYNVAARLLALVDAGVIERDSATTEAASKILEAAPIPAEIMAPEKTTDVGAAVSKNAGATRKSTRSAKLRRRQQGAAALAVGGGDQVVEMEGAVFSETDQKLREAMRAIVSRYDSYEANEIDADDTLDGPMLRMPSGDSTTYSGDEYMEGDEEGGRGGGEDALLRNNELLEVRLDQNGIQTGVVRDASGNKVEVLMPNLNRQASITPASRGRRSRRGGRGGGGGGRGGGRGGGGSGGSGNSGAKPTKGRATGGGGKQDQKKKVTGQPGGGKGTAKGTNAASERTRRRNERNKSSRANHNRKRGAQRKAAKGMF
jgi:uncharacterized membrane protein YgcG